MQDTIVRYLSGLAANKDRAALLPVFESLGDRYSSCALATAGLVITGTSGLKVPKIGATDFYAIAGGALVKIAAGVDMPALSGTVAHDAFNVFVFYVDAAGTTSSAMGTAGASLGAVKFPPTPAGKAIIGFIIINPTGTGSFVGGSTGLDAGTVTPNTVYVSPVGAFDPTLLIS